MSVRGATAGVATMIAAPAAETVGVPWYVTFGLLFVGMLVFIGGLDGIGPIERWSA